MRRTLLVAALALAATAACSTASRPVVYRAGDTVLMASAQEPDAYMLAIVGGTLTRNDRGCVALDNSMGGSVALLLPYGTKLAEDGQSLNVPELGVIRFGDQVQYGGGYGTLDGMVDIPSECTGGTDLAVWN